MATGMTAHVRRVKRDGNLHLSGRVSKAGFSGDYRFTGIDPAVIAKFPDLCELKNGWKVKYEFVEKKTKTVRITGLVERGQ